MQYHGIAESGFSFATVTCGSLRDSSDGAFLALITSSLSCSVEVEVEVEVEVDELSEWNVSGFFAWC